MKETAIAFKKHKTRVYHSFPRKFYAPNNRVLPQRLQCHDFVRNKFVITVRQMKMLRIRIGTNAYEAGGKGYWRKRSLKYRAKKDALDDVTTATIPVLTDPPAWQPVPSSRLLG